jgi:hypothetical protein
VAACSHFTLTVVDDREALRFLKFLNEVAACSHFTLAVVDGRKALGFFEIFE